MKPGLNVRAIAATAMQRIHKEYVFLLQDEPLSIETLLAPDNFSFKDFSKQFYPHPDGDALIQTAYSFGNEYGIWLPTAKYHITCALYLYPTASTHRMLHMMENLIIDFYLNDVMGRDVFKKLSLNDQRKAEILISNLADVKKVITTGQDRSPIEKANSLIIQEFKANSPDLWFNKFLYYYCHHIGITHKDADSRGLGAIPSIDAYMETRCHYAGMYHIVLWVEYAMNQFLDWEELRNKQLDKTLTRLQKVITLFGALSNDLFSFEKEVIDSESDSNLIMVIALNNPGLNLRQCILLASTIIRNLLVEYVQHLNTISKTLVDEFQNLNGSISAYVSGINRCMQACWLWQVFTNRYKRPHSIWKETTVTH